MAAIPLIPADGQDARPACAHPPHHVMEQAAEWYALLISSDAVVADQQRWLAWLDADPSHRQAWTYVERVSQRILAPLRETPDPRLTTDNLHAAGQRVIRRRRALVRIASLAGVGVFGWLGWRQTPLGTLAAAWTADYRAATGEIRATVLSDGSRVWLNTASAFNQDFLPGLRRLRLVAGEILIETGADKDRPFVVDTAEGRLRALGTRFTVRQEAGATLLAVYQGAVEIRTTGNAPAVVITAGHQARYTARAVAPATRADPAREAWIRGDLLANNLTLRELADELGRYTLGHIGVAPQVAQRRVFGTFPLRDVDSALGLLAQAAQVKLQRPLPWWTTLVAADDAAAR
ncbi:FecR family protein [Achromobacter deleyi]|nr:FecR domain-containing protein [Achromobacter deleyi]